MLLGNDAADTGDFQVGIRLAYALGRPVAHRRADARGRAATGWSTRAEGPEGTEVSEAPLPAVVTVDGGRRRAALPLDPGPHEGQAGAGRDRRRRAVSRSGRAGCGSRSRRAAPSEVEVLGKGAEAAPAVVDLLERLGVAPMIRGAGRDRSATRSPRSPGRRLTFARRLGDAAARGRRRRSGRAAARRASSGRYGVERGPRGHRRGRSRRTPRPPWAAAVAGRGRRTPRRRRCRRRGRRGATRSSRTSPAGSAWRWRPTSSPSTSREPLVVEPPGARRRGDRGDEARRRRRRCSRSPGTPARSSPPTPPASLRGAGARRRASREATSRPAWSAPRSARPPTPAR